MADITLRSTKGSPLTTAEVDGNFTSLNSAKYEAGDSPTFDSLAVTNTLTTAAADINGGTIDGTVIGGTTAAAGSFTSLGVSGTATIDNFKTTGQGGAVWAMQDPDSAIEFKMFQFNSGNVIAELGTDQIFRLTHAGAFQTDIIQSFNTAAVTIDDALDVTGEITGNNFVTDATSMAISSSFEARYGRYDSARTDISGIVSGTSSGALIEGVRAGHVVIGIRNNDGTDGFSIVADSTNSQGQSGFDTRVFSVNSLGDTAISGNLFVNDTIETDTISARFGATVTVDDALDVENGISASVNAAPPSNNGNLTMSGIDTAIQGLLGDSDFGGLVQGPLSGWMVFGSTANTNTEGFAWVSDLDNDGTYDNVPMLLSRNGNMTLGGALRVNSPNAFAEAYINSTNTTPNSAYLRFQNQGALGFAIGYQISDGTFQIQRYNTSGNFVDRPFIINQSTGAVQINTSIEANTIQAQSGSTVTIDDALTVTGNLTTNGVAFASQYRTDGTNGTPLVFFATSGYQTNFEVGGNVLRLRLNRAGSTTAPRFLIENNDTDLFQIDAQTGVVESFLPFQANTLQAQSGSTVTIDDDLAVTGEATFNKSIILNDPDEFAQAVFNNTNAAPNSTSLVFRDKGTNRFTITDGISAGNLQISRFPAGVFADIPLQIRLSDGNVVVQNTLEADTISARFGSTVTVDDDLDVTGELTLDTINATGSFINVSGVITTDNRLQVGGTGELRLIDTANTGGFLGKLDYRGLNDAAQEFGYASVNAVANNTADGSEQGSFRFNVSVGGSAVEVFRLQDNQATFFTKILTDTIESESGATLALNDNTQINGDLDVSGTTTLGGPLVIGNGAELTISSGAVTISGTYHRIDTEGDAATDDLTTINGGTLYQLLLIDPRSASRTVVAKDQAVGGNLRLKGDFTMDTSQDKLLLFFNGAQWEEVSRSDNSL